MPGVDGQEQVVAVIVPRHGKHPTPDDLAEFVAELLPAFKRPAVYHLVEALPRTEVGRLDRASVQRSYARAAGLPLSRLTAVADGTRLLTGPTAPADANGRRRGERRQPRTSAPEVAGDLAELGARLPGTGSRDDRGDQDTDEDLF